MRRADRRGRRPIPGTSMLLTDLRIADLRALAPHLPPEPPPAGLPPGDRLLDAARSGRRRRRRRSGGRRRPAWNARPTGNAEVSAAAEPFIASSIGAGSYYEPSRIRAQACGTSNSSQPSRSQPHELGLRPGGDWSAFAARSRSAPHSTRGHARRDAVHARDAAVLRPDAPGLAARRQDLRRRRRRAPHAQHRPPRRTCAATAPRHGGCQAACLLFWKEAWLERVESEDERRRPARARRRAGPAAARPCSPATTVAARSNGAAVYRCQATEIPSASSPLRLRELDQYAGDVRNWGLGKIVRGLVIEVFNLWQRFSRRQLPRRPADRRRASVPVPQRHAAGEEGQDAVGEARPAPRRPRPGQEQGGDRGHPRSRANTTAASASTPRWSATAVGRPASAAASTASSTSTRGEMIEINSDCIILEGVVCTSDYHRFCPRGIYSVLARDLARASRRPDRERRSAGPRTATPRGGCDVKIAVSRSFVGRTMPAQTPPEPAVDVGMPAYRRPQLIGEAIESVLAQTHAQLAPGRLRERSRRRRRRGGGSAIHRRSADPLRRHRPQSRPGGQLDAADPGGLRPPTSP